MNSISGGALFYFLIPIFFLGASTSDYLTRWTGILLLAWAIVSGVHSKFTMDRSDKIFITACVILPISYALNMSVTGWDLRSLDRPSHLLAAGAIYLLVRRKGFSEKQLWMCLALAGAGLAVTCTAHLAYAVWDLQLNRVRGPYSNAVPFGMHAATVSALGIGTGLMIKKKQFSIIWIVPAALAIGGGAVATFMSGTRTAWIAAPLLAIISQILIWPKSKEKPLKWILPIITLVALSGLHPSIQDRFWLAKREFTNYLKNPNASEAINTSIGLRLQSWRWGLEEFRSSPWIGVGFSRLNEIKDQAVNEGKLASEIQNFNGLHNSVIEHLASTGITGTAALVIFWTFLTYFFIKQRYDEYPLHNAGSIYGLLLLGSQFLSSMTSSLFASSMSTLVFCVLLAFFAAMTHPNTPSTAHES